VRTVRAASVIALSALGALAFTTAGARAAEAGAGAPTRLSVSAASSTVNGAAVPIHARLTDDAGRPVGGALLRLVTTTTFFGAPKSEVLDESTTDSGGRAVLSFSPTETGAATVQVSFAGDHGYAASQTSLGFDVREPALAYREAPVGIGAPWAHAYLILVPFLGIWITYGLVLAQVRRVRRAGIRALDT
jgi:hypothetical protein